MGVFQNNLMGAAAAAASAGGADFYDYQIQHSARFIRTGDNANTYLKRTPGSAGNRKTYTLSLWVKRTQISFLETFASAQVTSTTNYVDGYKFGTAQYTDSALSLASQGTISGSLITSSSYRDTSAWMHIVIRVDSTQATASNRFRLYVNGEQVTAFGTETYIAEDYEGGFCSTREHAIGWGTGANNGQGFSGYMAEVILADGTSYAPTQFGETKNGVWIPKDPDGTSFGTTGFHLDFASSSDLGNDISGNNNDFTNVGMSTHDQMLDTPTFNSSSNGGNFATLGPLWKTENITFAEGNLAWSGSANERGMMSNWAIPIGTKAYFEYYASAWAGGTADTQVIGINQPIADLIGGDRGGKQTGYAYQSGNGYKQVLTSSSSYGYSWTTGDVIGVAVDRVNHTINFYANSAWQGTFAISSTMELFPFIGNGGGTNVAAGYINFGQDGTFAGTKTAGGNSDDTGYGNFFYDVPAGFLAMCSGNLPVADAIDPAQTDDNFPQKLFDAKTYTGDGGTNAITGLGFQPDWVWIKERGGANNHMLFDSNRGTSKYMSSNTSGDEGTDSATMNTFGSDGFTVGSDGKVNASSDTYVAWNWRANGGTTAANSVGGTSSVTQVDPSKALSIVTYTGISGSSGSSTVGHGMGVVPQLIFHKARNATGGWWTQFAFSTNANYFLELNGTRAQTELAAGTYGAMSRPTTSVFSINGVDGVGGESRNYVAYCFANIEGYCKVGSYVGNGSTDGAFVYTGFKPAWVMTKMTDGSAEWTIFDTKRDPHNLSERILQADLSDAERTDLDEIDILSNGFKGRYNGGRTNQNGKNYIYLAMAHNPFKYATAR